MKIKNNYHKRLSFEFDDPCISFSIGPGEEKEVPESLGRKLLSNPWIEEVKERRKKAPKQLGGKGRKALSRQRSENS